MQITNTLSDSHKLHPQRLAASFLFFVFTFSLLIGYFSFYAPAPTSAAGAGVEAKYLAAEELLEQFPRTCGMNNFNRGANGEKGFAKNIKEDDFNDDGFWGYFGDQYITVGYSNEKLVGDKAGGADGIVSCRAAFIFLVKTLVTGDRKKWLKTLYDVSKYVNGNEFANTVEDKLAETVTAKLETGLGGVKAGNAQEWTSSKTRFDLKNIMDAFNKCWKFKAPPDASEAEKAKLRQKKENWELQLDGGDMARVNAGYRVEITVEGSYDNGLVRCDPLWDWAKKNKKLGANPLEDEGDAVKIASIISLLNSDIDKTKKCLALVTDWKESPLQDSIEAFANILVNGLSPLVVAAQPGLPAQIDAAKKCIYDKTTGFGDELTGLVDDPLASDPDNDESGGGPGGDKDVCLSKANQFIGWFACPVINLIDDFLAGILALMEKLLLFNITGSAAEGNVNASGNLEDSWNIFRALATILIMGGFLLALLVKGIKGE